jgi:hypothetical protein
MLPADPQVRRYDAIDRLVSIDFPRRGVIPLIYRAAREQAGMPLCLRAARLLKDAVVPGSVVVIATGWLDRPHVSLRIAETDGPPGAAILARALHIGLGAIPFVFVEEEIVAATVAVVQAAGLRCVEPDQALHARGGSGALHVASVIPLPVDREAAAGVAAEILARFDVRAFLAVEKGGQNRKGRIRTSRGADTTDALGKADALLDACRARGIPSIGIGDGGNEIGMGLIHDRLVGKLRNSIGPDGTSDDGVLPAGKTEALIAATVSNWGAYGLAAALAMMLEKADVLHSVELEEQVLKASAAAGFIDGVSGCVGPSADGLPLGVHEAIVRLLRIFVGDGINTFAWRKYPSETGIVAAR